MAIYVLKIKYVVCLKNFVKLDLLSNATLMAMSLRKT